MTERLEILPDPDEMRIVGIENGGNTCFAAAAMQLMMQIPRFWLSVLWIYPEGDSMKEVQTFVMAYLAESEKRGRVSAHRSRLLPVALGFAEGEPHSANEFLAKLLSIYATSGVEGSEKIREIFGMRLEEVTRRSRRSEIQVEEEILTTTSCEEFMALPLETGTYVADALNNFWHAEFESQSEDGLIDVIEIDRKLVEPPLILSLTADMAHNQSSGQRGADNSVSSTLEVPAGDKLETYELYGIIDFAGRDPGHYRAYVKRQDCWYVCDDSVIREVDEKTMQEYLEGEERKTIPVTYLYFNVEMIDYLLDVSSDPELRIPRIIELTDKKELSFEKKVWVTVAAEENFNPNTLKFQGYQCTVSIAVDATMTDLHRKIIEMFPDTGDEGYTRSIWADAAGILGNRLPTEGKAIERLKTDHVIVLRHQDELTKGTFVVLFVKYLKKSNRTEYLGCRVVDRRDNIRASITSHFQEEETPGIWFWCNRTLECIQVTDKMQYCDVLIHSSGVIILETDGINQDFDDCIDGGRMTDELNIVYFIPNYFANLSAPVFFMSHRCLFLFGLWYDDRELWLWAPVMISWDDFDVGVRKILDLDDDKCFRLISENGEKVNRDNPPVQLIWKLWILAVSDTIPEMLMSSDDEEEDESTFDTGKRAIKDDAEVEIVGNKRKVTFRRYTLSMYPPLNMAPPVPTRPPLPVISGPMDEEERMLMMLAVQGQEDEQEREEKVGAEEDSFETVQERLIDLQTEVFNDPSEALAAYSKIVSDGPLLTSGLEYGNVRSFTCKRVNCGAHLDMYHMRNGKYRIESAVPHRCVSRSKTSNAELDEQVRRMGPQQQLTSLYMNEVRSALGDKNIKDQRIRRSYQRVTGTSLSCRIKSWGLLPSLCQAIKADGGTASIILTQNQTDVSFCGIMPNFCHAYVTSKLFFPVVSIDGSFHCGVGRGQLLSIVTLTGSRNVFAIAWAWAVSEDKTNVSELIKLLKPTERSLIKSVISDEGGAILSSVDSLIGAPKISLCAKHREMHIGKTAIPDYWQMIKSQSLAEYRENKEKFRVNCPSEYSKIKDKIPKLSRWERDVPRDLLLTNGIVESFNAKCLPWRACEPFELLRQIYAMSRQQIISLIAEPGKYTASAQNSLTLAVQMATRLKVTSRNLDDTYNIHGRGRDFQVDIRLGTCSCKFHMDCGLPCPHMIRVCMEKGMSWEPFVHPRYICAEIRAVFPSIPVSIDFSSLTRNSRITGPPIRYSLKTKSKRGKGAMDIKQAKSKK